MSSHVPVAKGVGFYNAKNIIGITCGSVVVAFVKSNYEISSVHKNNVFQKFNHPAHEAVKRIVVPLEETVVLVIDNDTLFAIEDIEQLELYDFKQIAVIKGIHKGIIKNFNKDELLPIKIASTTLRVSRYVDSTDFIGKIIVAEKVTMTSLMYHNFIINFDLPPHHDVYTSMSKQIKYYPKPIVDKSNMTDIKEAVFFGYGDNSMNRLEPDFTENHIDMAMKCGFTEIIIRECVPIQYISPYTWLLPIVPSQDILDKIINLVIHVIPITT